MNPSLKIGIGTDVHRLVEGRPLVLGGVAIPFERGLSGHSDADVVLHAVTDALLGAAGLPDIGELFPDTDPAFRGADSARLLSEVVERVDREGYAVSNLDLIVHAERPKLSAWKRPIAERVAELTRCPPNCVSVKAKTNEGLDAVGRGEAIACTAVVLLRSGIPY
ncbi:MAG: 2-C-methyl-D-erythritol 2,4-cyclodiphosphate synthase [Phycisphaerae bacterium]|nr:MAG: 2-C-methyl-D-erythritol 2,4-cyclodiphosphate synthase [Planctomycetota bacterium]KAB2950217.1 MAG: 2-C-methyl-D-erythritol 2,4-cyclodiphosphate synthase [Phycisphaerae bacterium]MBE7456177.1 2-C-methyl-D-erythritol 2,4-cyclodiphosphate synthase [Planctomycetia bacterium]MCK6465982.1 2-C-methyl-D-erythritol 2,4-cyclodiphosphate synthase [Phycisphaerae bacterium]MCL4718518.1 2-C-methyl-D-erythritol 2,4-cyclodiphosphate synthase [Phycisphaerae bacterium]